MKIRILLLATDLNLGGAPLVVKQLACGLDKARFEVHVAGLAGTGPVADDLCDAKIPTTCLGATGPTDLRILGRLARLIYQFRPHILHCFLLHANVIGRIVGRLLNVPFIFASIRTAERHKRWHLTAENLTCRLGDLTLCVSPSVRYHTRRFSHVPAGRVRVIPNGVNVDLFAAARPADLASVGLERKRNTLIFVGRLDPVKNLDLVIRTLPRLLSQHNLQLLIVGDGPQRVALETLVGQMGLTNRVAFAGFQRHPERFLAAADIFVIASTTEGMSGATLEAMAVGLPVVAAHCPGLTDIIDDRSTGLLVQRLTTDSFCQAISLLAGDPAYAAQLGRAGQERVSQAFTLSAMVREYSLLYENTVTTGKTRRHRQKFRATAILA